MGELTAEQQNVTFSPASLNFDTGCSIIRGNTSRSITMSRSSSSVTSVTISWNPNLVTIMDDVTHVVVSVKNPVELLLANILVGADASDITAPSIGFPPFEMVLPCTIE